MKWERGRLNTGYEKLRLFQSKRLMCDLWLLRSAVGVEVPEHVDTVAGYRHYRANLILREATTGGVFAATHSLLNLSRLKVFRSDCPHCVSTITRGQRLVLSAGLCLPVSRTTKKET